MTWAELVVTLRYVKQLNIVIPVCRSKVRCCLLILRHISYPGRSSVLNEAILFCYCSITHNKSSECRIRRSLLSSHLFLPVSTCCKEMCVMRFDQSECVICRVIFALGKSRFQRYTWLKFRFISSLCR